MSLVRFGVSLDEELLDEFDHMIRSKGYVNRSEALRDLIRNDLVAEEWLSGQSVAGVVTIVYNHHQRGLVNRVLDIQHDYQPLIVATQHIHLDHDNCLEVIVVKGAPQLIETLVFRLNATKGIKHTSLARATTGEKLC